MKILHYVKHMDRIKGGIKTSIRHQRKAFDKEGIEYTTDPSEEYDILHLNTPSPSSVYQMIKAKRSGKKVVFHSHVTGEDFRNSMRFSNLLAPLVGKYTNFLYSRCDLIIAPSEYTKKLLESKNIDTEIVAISNGIDTERLEGENQERERLQEKYGVENFCAVNLGLVFERKGLSDFVETGRKLPEIDFRWFGPQMNKLLSSGKTQRKVKKSPENVKFPGFIDDIRDAFTLGDVFFFPTKEENQGISLLEAAYKENPVVVRDIPTYEGWLEDGSNCLKADSVEGFKDCLERIRDNEELREKLAENAREMAEKHTLDKIGEELRSAYETL